MSEPPKKVPCTHRCFSHSWLKSVYMDSSILLFGFCAVALIIFIHLDGDFKSARSS
ncbi:hypothetical protein PS870_05091 [Pseudomonas fluorescens]|uniref:Uncharacterized protein n=1 Tax=Pseudomonas fluorescens TaxID=294 RepID=A0A5E7PGU7_PSEFL|nr:hypothetical protein PS870_05091 [Pseudomonas fluorescens]